MRSTYKSETTKYNISLILITAFIFLFSSKAWATLTIFENKSGSQSQKIEIKEILTQPQTGQKDKAHAPEPSTIALFGSGILGMIISLVQRTYGIAKRIFDITIAVFSLILLTPLILLIALLLKCTSRGPILFTQTRVGKDGELFEMFKFRTMHVDAEKYTGPVWAKENDPRLIPSGKLLRKIHMDEIPQFINVIQGEMSIIGPRPERPVFVERFKKEIVDYEKRLQVKPGITGLAQVWHKYAETIEDVRKKIKYDLLYIKKLCLWTDLRIMFRTIRVIFTGEGAR